MAMIYIKNKWLTEMPFLCCWLFVKKSIVRANIFTVRNSSCGKVMFSQVSVILSTGGGMHGRGVCMVEGGMHGRRGHAW